MGWVPGTGGEQGNAGLDLGGGLGQQAARGPIVELHGGAGAVNDEDAAPAQFADHLVDARRHFSHARRRAATPMLVPHVAEDHCRLAGFPLCGGFDLFPLATARLGFHEPAELQLQRFR